MMGQSISKYSTLHKQLQLPSLMVEIFSDHYIDRLEALDTDVYITENIYLWPRSSNGEHYIPYVFADNHFSKKQKAMIRKTMDLINANTCAKFIPSAGQQHVLVMTAKPEGYWACTGFSEYSYHQNANFDPKFGEKDGSSIAHELFHVLGRLHEHQREDRDDYITVHQENIEPGFEDEMPKIRGLRPDIKYDHKSVMHYPPTYKDANGNVKIQFTAKNSEQFSKIDQVQPSDLQHINIMYRCEQKYFDRAQHYQVE